jgi:phosphoribosylglycinamide formyltransferase-1
MKNFTEVINMKKIVVMASGEGSNFSAIVDSGIIVDCVITDNKNANVIERAKNVNIPVTIVDKDVEEYQPPRGHVNTTVGGRAMSSVMFDNKILKVIPEDTDLIVLAGYCRILSSHFCETWDHKIINIHPSLLPAFSGTIHAIEEAWDHGCKVFGVTVHWVIPEIDAGPIIDQRAIHKLDGDTLKDITQKIHKVEHYIYPATIKELIK